MILLFSSDDELREHTHTHTIDNTYHGGYWSSKKNQMVRSVFVVLQNDHHYYYHQNLISLLIV